MFSSAASAPISIPRQSLSAIFARFLRFGLLAWGGPVAQIAMIRHELVERERWIGRERFNRVLAVYQALPGPEATELCCYFGMISRGRIGCLLAGLAFMLPGLVLMLGLSWVYATWGLVPLVGAAFAGMQPAVAALIVRAVVRISRHALRDRWHWAIAVVAFAGALLGVHFALTLVWAGIAGAAVARRSYITAIVATLGAGALGVWLVTLGGAAPVLGAAGGALGPAPSEWRLLGTGLKAGLLTFGGAYTSIPFVHADAVGPHGWMTEAQFLDGLALSGVLPAPLIIFATFVGYIGTGLPGALIMTAAIFAPAFSFTLIGHELFERLVENPRLHALLDAVTAGVVGLIAATAVTVTLAAVRSPVAGGIFILALVVLLVRSGRATVPLLILAAAAAGLVLMRP